MSNRFIGRGNLGSDPELKHVEVSGEHRALATFSVKFDRQVPTGENTFEDKGGFWLPIQFWGTKAESANDLLRKGARVRIEGQLVQDTWTDGNGIAQSRLILQADSVDLDLSRLLAVTYKPKANKNGSAEADDTSDNLHAQDKDGVIDTTAMAAIA